MCLHSGVVTISPYSPFIKQDRFHFNSLFIWRIGASKYIRTNKINDITIFRSSHQELFLIKGILKICSKFTGEHPCRSVISIKFASATSALLKTYISNQIFIILHYSYLPPKSFTFWIILTSKNHMEFWIRM